MDAAYCSDRVARSVGRLVCWIVGLFVTLVSPAKMAEPLEMPFGLKTQVGRENDVLDGGVQIPQWEGAILRGGRA